MHPNALKERGNCFKDCVAIRKEKMAPKGTNSFQDDDNENHLLSAEDNVNRMFLWRWC